MFGFVVVVIIIIFGSGGKKNIEANVRVTRKTSFGTFVSRERERKKEAESIISVSQWVAPTTSIWQGPAAAARQEKMIAPFSVG